MNQAPLKIIFAGTPAFAATALEALLNSPHQVIAVYTQPDRPAGRGRKLTASPVKELALKHGLPVHQPESLKDSTELDTLQALAADIMVVAAYGLILPVAILNTPKLGCLNIHASLLPRWRGAAPIQRAILANDKNTGITIMQMEKGLDTGAMLYKVECPIEATDTSAILHDRLATLGATAIVETLNQLPDLKPEIQNESQVTYAQKITKEEAELNWHEAADDLARKIRAFNSWPVAFFKMDEQLIRVWDATVISHEVGASSPGEILKANTDGIDIATQKNILRLLKIQLPGARQLPVADVLNARHDDFKVGKRL